LLRLEVKLDLEDLKLYDQTNYPKSSINLEKFQDSYKEYLLCKKDS